MDAARITSSSRALTPALVSYAREPAGSQPPWPSGEAATSFAEVLAAAQGDADLSAPPTSRWASLAFLNSYTVPLQNWRGAQSSFSLLPESLSGVSKMNANVIPFSKPLSMVDFPRPAQDNGWGIHWIPTVSQSPEVVDRFVNEAAAMGMKWVVFLTEGAQVGANDYLVNRLAEAGIEPIMRVYTPGLAPIEGDLQGMVEHYRNLGVHYFQLYNEPNLYGVSKRIKWQPRADERLYPARMGRATP